MAEKSWLAGHPQRNLAEGKIRCELGFDLNRFLVADIRWVQERILMHLEVYKGYENKDSDDERHKKTLYSEHRREEVEEGYGKESVSGE